jgi:hypothetical protein
MKTYWLYTDNYPGDYDGPVPDDEWAICEFEYGDQDEDEILTAIVTKVIAIGTNEYVDTGFEMDLYDDALTNNHQIILKFLFERKFYD